MERFALLSSVVYQRPKYLTKGKGSQYLDFRFGRWRFRLNIWPMVVSQKCPWNFENLNIHFATICHFLKSDFQQSKPKLYFSQLTKAETLVEKGFCKILGVLNMYCHFLNSYFSAKNGRSCAFHNRLNQNNWFWKTRPFSNYNLQNEHLKQWISLINNAFDYIVMLAFEDLRKNLIQPF